MKFFDANILIGQPTNGSYKSASSKDEILKEMDDAGIDKALIWHIVQYDSSPIVGNSLVNEVVLSSERLCGCWTILPPQTEEVMDADFFSNMKKNKVAGLRAFPGHHNYLLNRQVFGKFFRELSERRIPLFLHIKNPVFDGVTWHHVYDLIDDFPELTCVLCDVGGWPSDRYTWPLLENYPDIYIETSMVSMCARALEETVRKYGAGRLVFGSGFPLRYPSASKLQLVHAEILDEDKSKIAFGNLEKLIAKVEL